MDYLMPNNSLSLIFLAVLLVGVVFLLQWVWRRPLPKDLGPDLPSDSRESEVTAKSLMTTEEATFFNLIRLAAQDHYLILVKLPILQIISVADTDEEARKTLLRTIQSVRLDVVLAHPGTLQATTVLRFQRSEQEDKRIVQRDHVVNTVLKAAGINVVMLKIDQTYSVEQITTILGLNEED